MASLACYIVRITSKYITFILCPDVVAFALFCLSRVLLDFFINCGIYFLEVHA